MIESETPKSWMEGLSALKKPEVLSMLFLGFSAGLPLLLIFSSLSLWLREAGVERSAVTYFSWAALGYSFKFIWAPLVDCLPIPFFSRVLGSRRSWLLLSQVLIICSIVLMAFTDPASSEFKFVLMALAAVMLGFSAATQDIVIDAYRIEAVEQRFQSMMSATYIAGYRVGMVVSGAGALFLASYFGSSSEIYSYEAWRKTYLLMSCFMFVGILTSLIIKEPETEKDVSDFSNNAYARLVLVFLLSISILIGSYFVTSSGVESLKHSLADIFLNAYLANFLIELLRLVFGAYLAIMFAIMVSRTSLIDSHLLSVTYVEPVKNFFTEYGVRTSVLLLSLIGLFRISDIVLGVISNVFYQDLGFSKVEIAEAVKVFGVIMAIIGGFCGGVIAIRVGVMRMLFISAMLVVVTNLLFILLANAGPQIELLYLVVAADNFVAGLASAAFVAFLSSLVDIRFTATQYAIFSSLMTLIPKVLGGYSGAIVDNLGYTYFFLIASFSGLPVLVLIYFANKALRVKNGTIS